MPLRDESKYYIKVEGEPEEVTQIRKKILDSFNDLEFIEEGHKYFRNGQEYASVSSIAARFEEEFDTDAKAEAYALKNGETPEYWKRQWLFTNQKATTTGTQVHSYGESMAWLHMGFPENITADKKYSYNKEENWLIPTRTKEEAALAFWNDLPDNVYVILPETRVYTNANPDLPQFRENYAGTFDLLLYYKHPTDPSKSGLCIRDWKTNREIYKEYSRSHNKMMLYPFNSLYDEPFGAYTIQLNCYQIPLEDIGLKILDRKIIWLKEDGTYELIPVDNCTNTLRKYFL